MAKHSRDHGETGKLTQQTKKRARATRRTSHGSSRDSSHADNFQSHNDSYHPSAAGSNPPPSHEPTDEWTHESETALRPDTRTVSQDQLVAEITDSNVAPGMDEGQYIEADTTFIIAEWGSADDGRASFQGQAFEGIIDRPVSEDEFYDPAALSGVGSQFPEFSYQNIEFTTYDQSTYDYPATGTYDYQTTTALDILPNTTQYQLGKWVYENRNSEISFTDRAERNNYDY